MSHDLTIPSSFDGTVRLFPLPNVVLFPRVLLPLHIFEPRYRQMTADALATDRLIAMVLLQSGPEEECAERPALCSVGCLGKIVSDQRLEDGRYNILLHGLSRIRILSEIDLGKLYRNARVELLHDLHDSGEPCNYRDELKALGLDSGPIAKLLENDLPLEALVDILAFGLGLKIQFKQELLEELDVGSRARRLLHYLKTEAPATEPTSVLHKFPPDFSTN